MFADSQTLSSSIPPSGAHPVELRRQEEGIELIASENYATRVLAAPGQRAHQQVRRGIRASATTAVASS